ncbi:MAG: CvpA family protein [Planctomycetota bacterium]
METYDIVMLVVVASAGIYGAIKGFAWQVASIASIVVSYIVAYRYREPLSQSIEAQAPWNRFLAMLILFVGTSLVIWVAFNMVKKSIDRMKLREFDRQIGALFGLLKGALYCTLITLFAVTLMGETVRQSIVASKSGRFIARALDRSESVIPPEIHDLIRPYLDKLDAEFADSEGIASASQGPASAALPATNGVPYWQQTLSNAWRESRSRESTPGIPAGFQSGVQGRDSSGIQNTSQPGFPTESPPVFPTQGGFGAGFQNGFGNGLPSSGFPPPGSTASPGAGAARGNSNQIR